MDKELHIWMYFNHRIHDLSVSMVNTLYKVRKNYKIIHTTQPHFCQTKYLKMGYRLFIHMLDDSVVEIKLGKNECTDRFIKLSHNLEKLLLANEFGKAVE